MTNACKACDSQGFDESILGPDRCTFCDGTEGGNPPSDADWIEAAQSLLQTDFGLPSGLARAVAVALLEREQTRASIRNAPSVVLDHMDSDEPPMVDPKGDYE